MRRILNFVLLIILAVSVGACARSTAVGTDKPQAQVKQEQKNKMSLELQKVSNRYKDSSEIFAVNGTNGTDEGFEKLIELMKKQKLYFYKSGKKPQGLIDKDDVVLIKFNCQWADKGGTNTDLIKSVVQAITKHPEGFEGEIIIADNGQAQHGSEGKGGSIQWAKSNAVDTSQSVKKVADEFAKSYKVSAMTWDGLTVTEVKDYTAGDYKDGFIVCAETASTGIRVSYPKFKTQYGTYVSFKDGIWDDVRKEYDTDRLKVINMPVLKSHTTHGVTACIKNYMGTTSDKLTKQGAHNSIALGGMGTQMAGTRMPILNIIDAIWINPYPRRGPVTDYRTAVETDIIAASTDPGALDYWSAKYILMEIAKKKDLILYESMDPESRQPGTFGYWLAKSVEELQKAGIKSNLDEEKIRVYVDTLDK